MSTPGQPLAKTSSVQGVALRVTRLNLDGSAVTDANAESASNVYTMNRFVTVTFTPVYDGANTIQQQLANGNFSVTYQTSDIFQRIEVSIQIAGPDPEFNEIAMGGTILRDEDGIAVGWAPTATGEIDQPNGVALEVWSYAISGGRQAVDRPYYHWMFPRLYLHPSDDSTVENDVMSWNATGWGNDNPNFAGSGVPGWDWETDRPYQYARVATAPINVNGYEPLVGGTTSEVQTLSVTGAPTGGTFTLTYAGQTTAPIAFDATAAAVRAALEALSNLSPASFTSVTGGPLPGTPVVITFAANLGNVAAITADDSGLTGGTDPAVAVTTTTPGA